MMSYAVKVMGTDDTWKENIYNYLNTLKATNLINDFDQCRILSGKSRLKQTEELLAYFRSKGTETTVLRSKGTEINLKINLLENKKDFCIITTKSAKAQIIAAIGAESFYTKRELKELDNIASWSCLFQDGKFIFEEV